MSQGRIRTITASRLEISDWISFMVLVKKKNGKMKICVDYRKLNDCTQNDHFLLPFISPMLEKVKGMRGTPSWTGTWGIIKF